MAPLTYPSSKNRGLVTCAIPGPARCRTRPCLYAITFSGKPEVVKVGYSYAGWGRRKSGYTHSYGGVSDGVIFSLYDECPNVEALERDVLVGMSFPLHSGREWFLCDLPGAVSVIERTLDAYGADYGAEWLDAVV